MVVSNLKIGDEFVDKDKFAYAYLQYQVIVGVFKQGMTHRELAYAIIRRTSI